MIKDWHRLTPQERTRFTLVAILAATFLVRVVYRVRLGEADFFTNGYAFFYEYAKNIVAGKGLWLEGAGYAMRPPAYPYFLSASVLVGGNYLVVVIPEALFGTATAFLAYLIGKELFNERSGLIAALITAFYPYYVVHDTALQETSMLTLAGAWSVYLLLRARLSTWPGPWLLAGLMLGASVLVRTTALPFALGAFAWSALVGQGSSRERLQRTGWIFLAFFVVLGAWLERNELLLGRPVLTTEAGYQFWTAQNPETFSRYPRESMDRSREAAFASMSAKDQQTAASLGELASDDFFLQKGLEYVRGNPQEALVGALRKIAAGFSWILNPVREPFVQAAYFVSYVPVLILGLLGMVLSRRNWKVHSLIYLQFLSFIVVSAAFFAHTSHRSHLDVYLIVFAAFVVERLFAWIRQPGAGKNESVAPISR